MKTVSEIQKYIFDNSGLKTSVKKGTGSMKGYLIVWPQMQSGKYPDIPRGIVLELIKILPDEEPKPLFCTASEICIYGIEDDRKNFKRERKPKEIHEMKVRTWGSKNSQIRLDLNTRRYADKLRRNPNGHARYY